jgi:uncharacterized protein YdaT
MPWYNDDLPASYRNQPPDLRQRALEIANKLLMDGVGEDIAIATALKRARQYYEEIVMDEIPPGFPNT